MSRIHFRRFLVLNMIGAAVWATVIGVLGYLFGSALEILLEDLKRYERTAMLAIVIVGTLVWTIHLLRRGKRKPDRPAS